MIVGRCADYILRDYRPCRIFIHADLSSRIRRCMERSSESEQLTEKETKQKIQAIDKNRAKYYEYYTGGKWGDKENYDLCINTTGLEIKKAVEVVAKMFR